MRVLVVDDEPLARIGMRSIVPWEENGFTLVGEAKNGVEALELARKYRPDLILSDIVMPEMDGLTFIREVRRFLPDTRLIMMMLTAKNTALIKTRISPRPIEKSALRLSTARPTVAAIMPIISLLLGRMRFNRQSKNGTSTTYSPVRKPALAAVVMVRLMV
mgnify:CR=1 FL=1